MRLLPYSILTEVFICKLDCTVFSPQLCFRECDYPAGFVYWIGGHALLFLFLFADFYYKAYTKGRSARARKSATPALGTVGGVVCNLPSVCEVGL